MLCFNFIPLLQLYSTFGCASLVCVVQTTLLEKSAGGMVGRSGKTPRLAAVAAEIRLDEGLLGLLRGAFDSEGQLSGQ